MSSHVISGLKKKRPELAQELQDCQRNVERLDTEVRALDSAILIYDCDYMPDTDTYRASTKNKFYLHGEAVKLIREYFAGNEGPQATTEIVTALAGIKGLSLFDNKKLSNRFYMATLRSLHHLAKKGELVKLKRVKGIIRWEVPGQ